MNTVKGNTGKRTLKWQHRTKWKSTVSLDRTVYRATPLIQLARLEVEFTKLHLKNATSNFCFDYSTSSSFYKFQKMYRAIKVLITFSTRTDTYKLFIHKFTKTEVCIRNCIFFFSILISGYRGSQCTSITRKE